MTITPAAADTLLTHFKDTNRDPDYYDLIVTGDLGKLGSEILLDLLEEKGLRLGTNYTDCGHVYFSRKQDAMCGGSGCGCSASIFTSFIMEKLNKKQLNRVLFLPTGALMSTTASQQGDSIPGVCHGIVIENLR